ncbi:ribosome biogenesis GTP-binding protein YsxC/EngB [Frateuria aurantia DSM 6220]|uniref:Probable GTP-binding protein EngB n=2 Tax=Frateuria aurantia TaxID=81475 RepID=H8KZJ2_FRAAD|nr:ribosome biogenesis GTP-binding protein YsxC/EngB [Frateuria aurantia DSM 6220]
MIDYHHGLLTGQMWRMASNPLQGAQFILAAHQISQLPEDSGAEVAFAGRSNAGKSSALNALTGQKALARTSKTPGRTQQMVAFDLPAGRAAAGPRRLIDLPGYGYAKVPEALRAHWRQEIDAYLNQRRSLRGVILIMDIRHPLKDFDRMMLDFCEATGLACHVLLTKADKLSRNQAGQALLSMRKSLQALRPEGFSAQVFSSSDMTGVDTAREVVMGWLDAPEAEPDQD